jgi:hypothetical protein
MNQSLSSLWQWGFPSFKQASQQDHMASKAEQLPSTRQQPRLSAGAFERIVSLLVVLGVGVAIVVGWIDRGDDGLDPEHGLGYALGVIGGSLMLILLAYPLRKRAKRRARAMGSVGFWFRFHMLLGLLGPLAVLYHARFSWGALNSAVALGAMIIVAGSGLIGRFLYSRVHRGYSDRKLEIRTLKQDMDTLLAAIGARDASRSAMLELLQPFEQRAVSAGSNFWSSAGAVIGLGLETRRAERGLLHQLPAEGGRDAATVRTAIGDYFQAVRRAAEFAFYDRLLRLWHLFHLPLFFLLVAAAILHIVAVHMY